MKTKPVTRLALKAVPVVAGGHQHDECAGDVGGDEIGGSIDGAVDMGFGRQMHHRPGLVGGKNPGDGGACNDPAKTAQLSG